MIEQLIDLFYFVFGQVGGLTVILCLGGAMFACALLAVWGLDRAFNADDDLL